MRMAGILKILLKKLIGIDFVFIGTFNLYLQGIEIRPRDIDLLTDNQGIKKIGQNFKSSIGIDDFGYKETKFKINNFKVHVVSAHNNSLRPKNFKKKIVWLHKNNLRIPVMPLELELSFYQQAGRQKDLKKVKLIKTFINKNL